MDTHIIKMKNSTKLIPACIDCSSTEIKKYKADGCEHYYHICDICYIKYKYAIELAPKPVEIKKT